MEILSVMLLGMCCSEHGLDGSAKNRVSIRTACSVRWGRGEQKPSLRVGTRGAP